MSQHPHVVFRVGPGDLATVHPVATVAAEAHKVLQAAGFSSPDPDAPWSHRGPDTLASTSVAAQALGAMGLNVRVIPVSGATCTDEAARPRPLPEQIQADLRFERHPRLGLVATVPHGDRDHPAAVVLEYCGFVFDPHQSLWHLPNGTTWDAAQSKAAGVTALAEAAGQVVVSDPDLLPAPWRGRAHVQHSLAATARHNAPAGRTNPPACSSQSGGQNTALDSGRHSHGHRGRR